MRTVLRGWVLAGLTAAAAGCGPAADGLVPVSGAVTAGGRPVPSGTVTFYPDAAKGNATPHLPTGIIGADGRYELYVPGGRRGAPPGWYRVVVYAVDDPRPGKPNRYFTHKKYADATTTPVRVEVTTPDPGRYDLALEK